MLEKVRVPQVEGNVLYHRIPPKREMQDHTQNITVGHDIIADFQSIGKAVDNAKSGQSILILPGVYESSDSIYIDKNIKIVGQGNSEDIIVKSHISTVFVITAESAHISNITVIQETNFDAFGISVDGGSSVISGCNLSSKGLACISITSAATPQIRNNRIYEGNDAGILLSGNTAGVIENNYIERNRYAGIEVKGNSNPLITSNKIYDGLEAGLLIHENGTGLITKNDIARNKLAGIEIRKGGNPRILENQIYGGGHTGIFIHSRAVGNIENNDIFNNKRSGVAIQEFSNPKIKHNTIKSNGEAGVIISDNAIGTLESNEIISNSFSGVQISTGANPSLTSNRISFNLGGVMINNNGGATLVNNDLRYNEKGGLYVSEDSQKQTQVSGNIEWSQSSMN